ncbi:PBSX family phage terminase large subunit [Microvirga alba]|uniref:PBSX family phage terminase large subunit n=1 Tax=Microvirga alba TaxID=2791025 RepID=A0A931BXM2_9HYPH|nr:PBSX family phage terminase large subunit [Microvirga alba]MBF9234692.1 PBSX family phage terminase large subunit [Microvirga alba]
MPVNAEFPEKLQCLFEPGRYKVLYGGRGGAKSWGVARALLILGAQRPLRVLCAREIQKSIEDSVHQLLKDQIRDLGLEDFYQVLNTEVRGKNGSLFIFAGLKHNIGNIKSKEGVDIVWVEEARTVSKTSWETLIPTIRKEGSEIWITFNPGLEEDETYQRFVRTPPAGAVVQKINWSDNPWFPEVLKAEKDDLKARDEDAYLNVWEGFCKQTLDGAVYASEIRAATEGGRITRVPYDASKPVHTIWDLGWADNTSIWFAQAVGFEFRLIDYLQDCQKPLSHYLQKLQERGYVYGTDWLPHDAQAKQMGSGRSVEELMRAAGRTVRIVPRLSLADGINAARTVFGKCWFDDEKTADGLQCLRHYRYELDEDKKTFKRTPLHDWASHGSDAFRYFAVAMEEPRAERERKLKTRRAGGWMGA